MNSLDSRLEALAFNYVNFGIFAVVNNLWTWIAVVTAAVSFWSIKAITGGGASFSVKLDHRSVVFDQIGSNPEPQQTRPGDSPNNSESATEQKTLARSPLPYNEGVTKGKFTVHYEEDGDGEREGRGELTAVGDERDGEVDGSGEWWERRARVLRMRNGDDGWYRYVDLSIINGNVVRLWDDLSIINGNVVRLWDEKGVHNGGRLNIKHKT